MEKNNFEERVINSFGAEWKKFDYSTFPKQDLRANFNQYFHLFPWKSISNKSEGFDMGCGTGRWSKFVVKKVGVLNCIDPSDALDVAKNNLKKFKNVRFLRQTTDKCTLDEHSQDFGYCLGVLHHVPNTQDALKDCAKLLKPGAPFLLYLYYNLENRPLWYRTLWRISGLFRFLISRSPYKLKLTLSLIISIFVYLPLARLAFISEKCGLNVRNFLLSDYRNKSFYQMYNDALDRFGTVLEKRFSKHQIIEMLENAGLENIVFSDKPPFWCCISYKSG